MIMGSEIKRERSYFNAPENTIKGKRVLDIAASQRDSVTT